MKFLVGIIFLTGYALACSAVARTWVDIDGRSLEAELVRKDSDSVILKTPDGKEFKLPLSRLSQATKQWLVDATTPTSASANASLVPEISAFFTNPLNASADRVAQANQLLAKANSLGGVNSVTVLGDNGVLINGVSLTGAGSRIGVNA